MTEFDPLSTEDRFKLFITDDEVLLITVLESIQLDVKPEGVNDFEIRSLLKV